MKQEEKIKKFMDDAFNEMFIRVGFERFDIEFTKKENWYTLKTWSLEEQKEFALWFIAEYRKRFKSKKAYAETQCRWFLFDYGWSLSNYDPTSRWF